MHAGVAKRSRGVVRGVKQRMPQNVAGGGLKCSKMHLLLRQTDAKN